MEAVPRMPMLSFELKHSPEPVEFSATLKQVIRDQYHEDPANYNKACLELEQLRQNSVQITHDFIGCSTLKKYYAQLQFLQSRFPLQDGGDPPLVFTWEDVQSGREYSHSDVKFEQACILYNIGALHSLLGAMDTRQSAEGMKVSCTHFQCAAWAFQHLRDHFGSSAMSPDMAHEILSFHSDLMLAQAQECILEKSMTDNRKSSITAKVAVQIAEFYRQALRNLDATNNEGLISSRRYKDWKRRIEIKILFYQTIMYFYLGSQAEEQQKHGERLAYFTAASERLAACSKLAKNDISEIHDSLRFTQDVVGGKFESAKKDNDFVYHEKVPPLDSLPEIKGASLVKGISFNPNDIEVSGPDIFQKLVPFEAHESSSLYSEEKAKLLRTIGEEVESKDAELSQFMASLKLDSGKLRPEPERLPQSLLEKCAAISVRPNAVKDLIDVMGALSGIATEVELGLQELRQSLEEEDKAEEEYQNKFGKRTGTIILPEIRKEMEICQEQHTRGSQSNAELHKAMNTHTANLKLISGPLDALEKALPSTDVAKSPEDEAIVSDLQRIMGKVEEMKSQRITLHEQLRNEVHKDDITTAIVTHEGTDTQTFFQNQLQKHDKVVGFLRQNMAAQDNVLKALTETNARFANMRKVSSESSALREAKIKELIHSYDVYEDLMAKSQKGLDFYRKLESNVSRLLQRAKGVIKANNEERDQMLKRYAPKESTPSRPAAPKPSSLPNVPPVPSSQSALPSFDGPKLKDYLPFMKPATFGPKAGGALPPTVPPNIPSTYPTLPSVGPGLSDMSSTSAGYPDVKQLPPGSPQPGHISSSLHTVARPSPTGSPSHAQKPQPPSQLAPRPPQPSAAPPPGSVPTLPEGYSFVENHPTGPAQPSDYQQPRQPQTNPRVRPKLDTTNTVSSVDTPIFSPTKDHADGHAVHTHNLHHAVGTRRQDVPDGQAQNLTQHMQHMNIAANQSYYNQYPGSTQQPDLIQGQRFPVPNGGQSFGQARFTGALSYSGSIPQQNYTTGYEHKRPPPMPPQSSRPLGPQSGAGYPAQPATPPGGISYQAQNQGPVMNYQHPQQSMWQGQSTSYAGTTGAATYRGQTPFLQGHQHTGQGQPPSNVHGIAPQQQPASQNYIPQQRSSVAGLSTAYSAQSSQPLSAGFPSGQQPQPGYQASVGSQYQQSQSGHPYPTSSSPNPQGIRQQVPSQQTSQTAQFYGNQTPHSQVQQRPVVPNQQQMVHPSTAQWQQTPTGPFPVQPGQGQQSVAGQQQSVQAGSQQNLAFARQAQQLPVGQQQPVSQGTLGQEQQQALQQNRQGYVQPNQSEYQLHGLPQQQQQQNQMQPGAGQQQGNYQTFSAQPPQQVNSPYQHQQQKQTQTGVSQQQTQQGQGMQQQRTMQYQPQLPGGQIPSAQQPTYHQPIMQNIPQVTGSIQAGYPIVQAQSALQIQPQQGNIPNQSVPLVTGSVQAGYQTLHAQSASQIPPQQGNIPNQTAQRQQQVSAGPVQASAGYGVAGSQPQSLSSQTQLPYQQSQTNFPVQTSIPGSQNYQKQQPQNLTQPFGVGGAPASSQPPQQPVLTGQAGHLPFNQRQQPQFTGIQPHAGQQMQPQHLQSQPISGRQFGTSQPIAGPTQQGPVHQQRQTGQQATFGQGQQGLQSQFNSYQQPNVLSSGQPTQQPQVQNFQQGHQILPQNLPQPTIQPAVVHTASVPAKDAAAPTVTQQSASVPFNIQSPTSAPANPPNVPVASFSPQAPNSAVSSTVEAGGISGGSQAVQQQQHTTGTTNITQHTPQKPGHLSRQISNSTTSSFDDILSSSPENQRDIPAADSVLTPTVLTAQEIAQQKEEALKLHDQQQQPKDPFSVKETLDKFVAEVEKYEKIVDSLCTPKLSGPSHLVTEWKELCQDQDKIAHQHSMAVARCYVIKNRDPDIMPYDDTRVLLNSGKDDYINASWVNDLAPSCPKFIATQGPLPVTLADFWLMVYEQGTEVIVMLSREDEPGKKMPVYWPTEKGHVTQHGPINLTLQSVKDKQLWLERIIYLTHSETKQGRTIVHLQYLGWPVSGLPEKIPYILQFINEVHYFYKQQRSLLKPVVVHCSNGVGRTGTFLAVYTGMQEINKGNGIIDLPALVAMMRSKRKHMMTDMEHLKFCYEAILYHAQDELMKRGILTNKKSFSDRLPKPGEKTHSRKPSEDFILGTAMGLHALESNVAKFTSKHMHGQSQDAMVTTGSGHESVASVPGQTHIPGIIARDAIMSLDSEILDNSQKSNIQTLPDLIQQQPENVTRTDDAAKTQSNVDMLSGLGGGQSENSGSDSASEGQGQGHVQGHSGISGSSSGTQSLGGSPLSKPKSLSSQSASLPPSLVDLQNPQTFTLDGTTGKKRITKASFSQKGKSLVSDNQSQDPNDPLSGLDPLWTIHKEKNTSSS